MQGEYESQFWLGTVHVTKTPQSASSLIAHYKEELVTGPRADNLLLALADDLPTYYHMTLTLAQTWATYYLGGAAEHNIGQQQGLVLSIIPNCQQMDFMFECF